MSSHRDRMPAATAQTLRAATEAAAAARSAAAHTAALALIEASGEAGRIDAGSIYDQPASLCTLSTPGIHAHVLATSNGDRLQLTFLGIPPDAYERVRQHVECAERCEHDECGCAQDPWPTLAELETQDGEHEIVHLDEAERGTAAVAFGCVELTLFEESAELLDVLIRLTRTRSG
jgi:hypothetical protein